jgi:hypothetical protein
MQGSSQVGESLAVIARNSGAKISVGANSLSSLERPSGRAGLLEAADHAADSYLVRICRGFARAARV